MAEVLATHIEPTWTVRSAGVAATVGDPAADQAIQVLRERGLDLTAHRAQQVDPELLRWADRVYVMTPRHLEAVKLLEPEVEARRLKSKGQVADPFGQGLQAYRDCADELTELIQVIKGK